MSDNIKPGDVLYFDKNSVLRKMLNPTTTDARAGTVVSTHTIEDEHGLPKQIAVARFPDMFASPHRDRS